MFSLTLIYFVILIAQIGNCIRKALSAHYSSGFEDSMQNLFFCNILIGDMYIDVSIVELFMICLVKRQTLGEGIL